MNRDVFVTDSDGNIGVSRASASEDVSGLIFDIKSQSSFPAALTDKVIELNALADCETYGIAPYGEENAVLGGIAYYHIRHFFNRIGGTGRLFVLFTDCSKGWTCIQTLQRKAHGLIYQVGVWTEQELFSMASADDAVYGLNLVTDLDAVAKSISTQTHAPLSILLSANTTKVKTSVAGQADKVDFSKLPSLMVDCRFVSVLLGESTAEDVRAMHEALTTKAPVGMVGIALGSLAAMSVCDCIGWVERNDIHAYIPGCCFGCGDASVGEDGKMKELTEYSDLSMFTVSDIDDKGYIFLKQYEGDESGVYFSFDHTCSDGDYRTIARNRVMNKIHRNMRAALLPQVNATHLVDAASGNLAAADRTEFVNAATAVLDAVAIAGEISGYSAPTVTQSGNLLQTDAIYINYSAVPAGCTSAIYVTEGYSLTV